LVINRIIRKSASLSKQELEILPVAPLLQPQHSGGFDREFDGVFTAFVILPGFVGLVHEFF